MTLEEGVARLLEQCDREDQGPAERRYLYTAEIRYLLGVGEPPSYEQLKKAILLSCPSTLRTCRKCGRERSVDNLSESADGSWMCDYGMCPT